ncbi:MAG: alpha-amylase [Hahellaceae bacterium]|nr:alpha-amylase [Hahellaceae bacterium]
MKANTELFKRLCVHLHNLYPTENASPLAERCLKAMGLKGDEASPAPHRNIWNEKDALLITYADSLRSADYSPLQTLTQFAQEALKESFSIVHLLPFFPYSSDDGFSVMDYSTVNPATGTWKQVTALSQSFKIMGDLVINHCSARSLWFENYLKGQSPGSGYFYEGHPSQDISQVVRPRTSPLLREVTTAEGVRYVWCTFSHDQVDLNFENPQVLLEMLGIIRLYLDKGIRWFRLDAVAFVWKKPGTPSINLPETHELIRLLRLLMEHAEPDTVIITETNIPNAENLTYFGNANEAHLIYNFSLPPLLLNTLVTGSCQHLKRWLMSMPPAQYGTTYLNFIASHDGIGLRPAEGLLSDWELKNLLETMQRFGGKISARTGNDGEPKPYEINISLWNALSGTVAQGPDQWQLARFVCAHAIMLALEGVPACYVHSLFGTENDLDRVGHTGHFRSINRHIWQESALTAALAGDSHHAQVFAELRRLLSIRRLQKAFHPNATQFMMHTGDALLSFWRQSTDRRQSIFAIHNISPEPQTIHLADLNLIATDEWTDLATGRIYDDRLATLTLSPYQFVWLSNR